MYSTVRHDVASKNWQDTEPATEAPEPPSKEQDVATAEKATEAPSSDCAAQQYAMLNALIPSFLGSVSSCLQVSCFLMFFVSSLSAHRGKVSSADGKRPAQPSKVPKPSAAPSQRPAKVQKTGESESNTDAATEQRSESGAAEDQGIPGTEKVTNGTDEGAFPEFMSLGAPKPKAKLTFPTSLPLKQLAKVLQVPPAPEAM